MKLSELFQRLIYLKFLLALLAIYFPTAAVGYFKLGDCMSDNMLQSMSDGIMKKIAEGLMMVHLISAVPIVVNPPNQYFEELMGIPKCTKNKSILIF